MDKRSVLTLVVLGSTGSVGVYNIYLHNPPRVISSKPAMPVGTLLDSFAAGADGLGFMRMSRLVVSSEQSRILV
jgi:hypothetical protein